MTPNEYQKRASEFASYGNNPMYPVLGLAEEAGEVCGKVAKFIRKNDGINPFQSIDQFEHAKRDANVEFISATEKELGDVCWMVAALATELGLSLEGIMEKNIAKLIDRKNRGVIVGEGDNR